MKYIFLSTKKKIPMRYSTKLYEAILFYLREGNIMKINFFFTYCMINYLYYSNDSIYFLYRYFYHV